jgi:hypothetical protein
MATITKGRVTFTEEASEGKFGYIKGTCKWAELLTIGLYGTYGIKMYGENVEDMETELRAMQKSAADEVKALDKKYELADVIKTDEDGNKFIGFKLNENKYDGTPNKVTFFDAGGAEVPDWDQLVGNGSTVKIKYRIAPYYMASSKMVGISFNFYAVQVIDLKPYGGGGDSGFGDETSSDGPIASEAKGSDDF